jgi:hypothetical protein
MTDETETTEQTEQTEPEAPESTGTEDTQEPGAEPGEDASPEAKLRHEAASWRRKLRDTEGKLREQEAKTEKLTQRIAAMERTEVERMVSGPDGLASADDFWTTGIALEVLRDEDGALDHEKVQEARDRILAERPHWRHRAAPSFDGGARQPATRKRGPSFGEAMKAAR